MGLGGILKLFGLCKVNNAYLKPVNDKLEGIEDGLGSIAGVADSGSQVVDAMKAGNTAKAVEVVLEFCEIDDELKELKTIKDKIDGGEKLTAAVAAANGPLLTQEILASVTKQVTKSLKNIGDLIPSIVDAVKEIADKLSNLKTAAASWSLAEKVGTPGAVAKTAKRAKKVKESAEEAKPKLEALGKSLAKLKG